MIKLNFDNTPFIKVRMVERAIKKANNYPTRKELSSLLRGRVSPKDMAIILSYLVTANRIIVDRRRIVWVAVDSPKLKKLVAQSVMVR